MLASGPHLTVPTIQSVNAELTTLSSATPLPKPRDGMPEAGEGLSGREGNG
jgi:hypothetical protein